MWLYIIFSLVIFFLLILGLRYEYYSKENENIVENNKKMQKNLFIFVFGIMCFLAAYRSINIGNDTFNYIRYFNIFSKYGANEKSIIEIGYQYYNVIVSYFTKDPHYFLMITAVIMYWFTGIYILKNSKNYLVTLTLFFAMFFSIYFSMLRQGLAMIISLYAYHNLKFNKKIKSLFLILIAYFIHNSAIVVLLLFLNFKKLYRGKYVYFAAIVLAALSMSGVLNNALIAIIPKYGSYFYGKYASTGWLAVTYEFIRNIMLYYIIDVNLQYSTREDILKRNIFLLLLLFSALGYSVNIFTRASEYFLLIGIVEFTNICMYEGKLKNRKLWIFAICSTLIVMFNMILVFRPEWNNIVPYEFWN